MLVRCMTGQDLSDVATVHKAAFPRQFNSYEWLQCSLNAAPRFMSFVVEVDGQIAGYIIWVQKSGFRCEAVLELEQLAVSPEHQGKGLGRALILDSLLQVKNQLQQHGTTLKHILVTTRADNFAQQLYRETLGAEVEATIPNLYSADEVLMIARNVSI